MLIFACLDGEFTSTNKTSSSRNLGNPFQSQGLVWILIMRFQNRIEATLSRSEEGTSGVLLKEFNKLSVGLSGEKESRPLYFKQVKSAAFAVSRLRNIVFLTCLPSSINTRSIVFGNLPLYI